jgi:hypothetical protein
VTVLAAGLAACSSGGGGNATATAVPAASAAGTESIYGKLTGPAALAQRTLRFHLTFTGPVATTADSAIAGPRTGDTLTLSTAAGKLAITWGVKPSASGDILSTKTCQVVITGTVPSWWTAARAPGSSQMRPEPAS